MSLIENIQVKAKVYDEKKRMTQAAIAIDMYNGKQKDIMASVISLLYPATYTDIANHITTKKLVQTIIDQVAILFQYPPEINIDIESDSVKQLFADVLAKSELWKKLIVADRMAELTMKVGLAVHWHDLDQRVVVDIITPDRCYIIPDPQDPTKASAVYYCISTEKGVGVPSATNVYAKWTREQYYECELDQHFNEIKIIPDSQKPNIYDGVIPIAWLTTLIEMDSFWVDHGYPLIEEAISIIVRECNLDIALDYQSFSTMVTRGLDSDKEVRIGVTRRIDLPDKNSGSGMESDAQAYYITPDAKLSEVSDIITKKRISAANEHFLSADAFTQDTSKVNSGYQLRLSERQLEEHSNLKKEIYRPEIIKLIKWIIRCYNKSSSGTTMIPETAPISITYADRKFASNPVEVTSVQITKIQAGLISLADAIRENNPDLTQEQAIEEAKRIKKEQAELNGGMITPITDEDLA